MATEPEKALFFPDGDPVEAIRQQLKAMADADYRVFHCRLIPTVEPERVLGVRTPALRQFARRLAGTPALRQFARRLAGTPAAEAFLAALPHRYYDENNLHGFLLESVRDSAALVAELDRFLPHVDNWATCDMVSPPLFRRRPAELLPAVRRWLCSPHPYTVRFGVNALMRHYLTDAFDPAYPAMAARACTGDYYVRMGVAWYFATALAAQYEAILPWFTAARLPVWVHNKALQKAVESRRLTPEQKGALRVLKR